MPANRLGDLVRGRRGIATETALRLGRSFRNGAASWCNLQTHRDLALAERELGAVIAREVRLA